MLDTTGLRRTGRTTRMLDHARRLASEGRAVYVVTDNEVHRAALAKQFGNNEMVKFETPVSIRLDWATMRVRGMHPNCVVIVDHWAIESRFGAMLEMLHRYDLPKETDHASR